jgi:zinc protease
MKAIKTLFILCLIVSFNSFAQKDKNIINTIVEKYFDAIGGKERAKQIHTFSSKAVGNLKDNQIILTKKLMLPNLSTSSMKYRGKVISKNTFDGKEGIVMQNDDEIEFTKEETKRHKKNRCIFPEFDYLRTAKYLGIEKIEQKDCYVLQIENTRVYYSVETGLKRKGVSIQEKDGKTFLQQLYFANYVNIEGLLFPTNLLLIAGNNKIEFQTRSIVINRDVLKSDFNIE